MSGLRTERVTLEVTYDCAYPAAEWVLDLVQEACSDPGESVRVVDEAHFDDLAQVAMERDAAIRERDGARAECKMLLAERDEATGRCKMMLTRVAELEAAAALAANAGGEANCLGSLIGSQEPVAWGVMIDSGRGLYGHYDFESEARGVCDAVNADEGFSLTVVPLYAAPVAKSATTPQPPRCWLTEEEREVILSVLPFEDEKGAKTLTTLLARSTPPRVKVPNLLQKNTWQSRDSQWIAAIREAGGEVE